MERLRAWAPPPALGKPPEAVTEAATVMLWGITADTIEQWLGAGKEETAATSCAALPPRRASPRVQRGSSRRSTSSTRSRPATMLVCPITAPSWAPVFARIEAAVSDIGGIMSHAAIVSREYGLPAVVGTGFGTKRIKTGQLVGVDGNTGVVTVLD